MAPSDYQDQEVKTPKVEVVDSEPAAMGYQFQQYWLQSRRWFDGLPLAAKGAVAIAILFIALSLLTKVLHFVASLISVAILGVILYGLYRVFLNGGSQS